MYKENKFQLLKDYQGYIAGSISGMCQVFLGQPFDIVKVRLQASKNPNASMVGVVKSIIQKEGVGSFYKGTTAPLVGVSGIISIQFGVYEYMKNLFRQKNNYESVNQLQLWEIGISGSIGALAASILTIPVEHIRIRMQLQSAGNIKYVSTFGCFQYIASEYGIRGVYKGTIPSLFRESFYGIQYATYEGVKGLLRTEDPNKMKIVQAVAGGISGLVVWSIIFPFDTLKSKMQGDSLSKPKFRGMYHCLQSTRFSQLYKGIQPCLLRSIPVNMGGFFVYEQVKEQINTLYASQEQQF